MTLKQHNLKNKMKKLMKGPAYSDAVFGYPYYDVILMLKVFNEWTAKSIIDMVDIFAKMNVVGRGLYEAVIRALDVYTVEEILQMFDIIKEYHEKPNYDKKVKVNV